MEYRFRGWDATGQKSWVYGDLTHSKRILQEEPYLEDRVMVGGYEVVPESVGLFTGRKDCHGDDLYEGDIVEIDVSEKVCLGYIFFCRENAGLMYRVGNDAYSFCMVIQSQKKGTIYENKELLEK